MNHVDPSSGGGNPLTLLINSVLYLSSNLLATMLVISQDSLQLIQLVFTCAGIFISNTVLIIVNWGKIKRWIYPRDNQDLS